MRNIIVSFHAIKSVTKEFIVRQDNVRIFVLCCITESRVTKEEDKRKKNILRK